MSYVYHLVPGNFVGEVLYPLNQLRETYPDLYQSHVKKYQGRERLLTWRIPILDCLWNDVLHFSPVHPRQIRDGFLATGYDWKPRRWFEVNPAARGFDESNTVIYYSQPRTLGDFSMRTDDFAKYDPGLLSHMVTLPAETAAYYAEAVAAGEPVFAFRLIPHVLHLGTVNCKDVGVIKV
ncbi:MAG: hypothetical protein R3300_02205 [Candidatus Promineifilaceae bacterium]|nr:hypothetical protein [Candidatus Promineifilaceae bacterium]